MQARLIVLVTRERSFRIAVLSICFCALLPLFGTHAFAQQPTQDHSISASELAKDNLDRVAASESQITAVLNVNPGLFVALKRWVAVERTPNYGVSCSASASARLPIANSVWHERLRIPITDIAQFGTGPTIAVLYVRFDGRRKARNLIPAVSDVSFPYGEWPFKCQLRASCGTESRKSSESQFCWTEQKMTRVTVPDFLNRLWNEQSGQGWLNMS